MRALVFLAALACGVSGCDRIAARFEPPARFVPPERPNDSCNSAAYRSHVGQPSDALAAIYIPEPYRVIEDGAPVTLDYNPARLNIDLGPDGVVVRLWCG